MTVCPKCHQPLPRLTDQQRQIVSLVLQGRAQTDIGKSLRLEPSTVRSIMRTVRRKAGVQTNDQLKKSPIITSHE